MWMGAEALLMFQNCNSWVLADNIENLGYYLVVNYNGHLKIVGTEQSILVRVCYFHGWYCDGLSGQHRQIGRLPNLCPLIQVCPLIGELYLLGNVLRWVLYFVVVNVQQYSGYIWAEIQSHGNCVIAWSFLRVHC